MKQAHRGIQDIAYISLFIKTMVLLFAHWVQIFLTPFHLNFIESRLHSASTKRLLTSYSTKDPLLSFFPSPFLYQ
jgi:ABC-type uncharacterized transport system involved in gliding motility auxiliary subunit